MLGAWPQTPHINTALRLVCCSAAATPCALAMHRCGRVADLLPPLRSCSGAGAAEAQKLRATAAQGTDSACREAPHLQPRRRALVGHSAGARHHISRFLLLMLASRRLAMLLRLRLVREGHIKTVAAAVGSAGAAGRVIALCGAAVAAGLLPLATPRRRWRRRALGKLHSGALVAHHLSPGGCLRRRVQPHQVVPDSHEPAEVAGGL